MTHPASTRLEDETYELFKRYMARRGVGKSVALKELVQLALEPEALGPAVAQVRAAAQQVRTQDE